MGKNCSRRQEIIEITYSLLLEKGYEDMGIQDILDKLNMTKGCLYYHFKSKKEIVIAVIEEIIKPNYESLWHDVHKASNPVEEIIRTIDKIFATRCDRLAKFGCPLGNLVLELSAKDKALSVAINDIIVSWQRFIELALDKAKGLKITKSELNTSNAAKFIIASFEGCIMLAKSSQDKAVLENCFSALKEYLISLSV